MTVLDPAVAGWAKSAANGAEAPKRPIHVARTETAPLPFVDNVTIE